MGASAVQPTAVRAEGGKLGRCAYEGWRRSGRPARDLQGRRRTNRICFDRSLAHRRFLPSCCASNLRWDTALIEANRGRLREDLLGRLPSTHQRMLALGFEGSPCSRRACQGSCGPGRASPSDRSRLAVIVLPCGTRSSVAAHLAGSRRESTAECLEYCMPASPPLKRQGGLICARDQVRGYSGPEVFGP